MFGIRFVVVCKNAPDNVLIQLQTQGEVELVSNAWTAVLWIAPLHRNADIYDFSGWSLRTRLPPTTGSNWFGQCGEEVESPLECLPLSKAVMSSLDHI